MPAQEGSYGLLQGWQHRRRNNFSFSAIPDLHGKTALVTGANSGIGKWSALTLAQRGAKVYLACRSKSKAEEAIKWIMADCKDAELEFMAYDADSLQGVYDSARRFVEKEKIMGLDILMLNAGTIIDTPKGSGDGVEFMFGVNHLAHFALTMGVMPAIRRAAEQEGGKGDVRIVVTASAGFGMHPENKSLHVEDEEIYTGSGNGEIWWKGAMPMYGRSKTCNILFAKELSRRLSGTEWGRRVRVNACHPGTVSTGLNSTLRSTSWFFTILETMVYFLASIPTDVSALSLLYAATASEVADRDITGQYLTPFGYTNSAVKGTAADSTELAAHLWQRSLELCKKHVDGFQTEVGV